MDKPMSGSEKNRPTPRALGFLRARVGFGGNILPLAAVVMAIGMFLVITQSNFATTSNLNSILFGVSIDFLTILGFTYVMVMREIDLSVGSVFALAGTLTGALLIDGWDIWPAAGVHWLRRLLSASSTEPLWCASASTL